MRPELELIEKIEQYLNNLLSPEDKSAFEIEMNDDPRLQEQVRLQQQVMRGIERATMKQKIRTSRTKFYRRKNFFKWGAGGLGVIAVLTIGLLFYQNRSSKQYRLPEFNEKGEKQWVDADRNVPAQLYRIDAGKDTVIETMGGIVMVIPSNAFVDNDGLRVEGKIDLVVKEALDPASIMKAGLSTRSGDRLLESGGMFYLDARKDRQILKIDPAKSIYTEVPTTQVKGGMQLFTGKRTSEGKIDWVDAKPLTHDLAALDINSLNFYPPGYLDSLQRWGYDVSNRQFTDSLYYSFASLFAGSASKADTTTKISNVVSERDWNDSDSTVISRDTNVARPSGRVLFIAKCASCHAVFKDVTGPKLGGTINDEYYKGDINKIAKWAYNVNNMVNSDSHYVKLRGQFGSLMQQYTPTSLSKGDIIAIFDYIENVYRSGVEDYYANPCGINPAKIKAIRTGQFQNTLLATREFEERLWWIHNFRNPALLDLYVNNLDKNLWYVDSIAVKICSDEVAVNPFISFAARRDGKVKNGIAQLKMLKDYYANKTRAFTQAITKTQIDFWNKQSGLDNDALDREDQHQADSFNRASNNFQQEVTVNLRSAFKQLGYNENSKLPSGKVYAVNVTTTGWCNIDRYVIAATENRATLDYTDPQSARKVIIEYQPVSIHVNNWKAFDRLYVYLLPDSLNSFMQLDGSNGVYSEKLNELMKYDLVCIAFKDEQPWFYSQKNIRPGLASPVAIEQISNEEVERRMNAIGNRSQAADLRSENEFFRFQIADVKRQKQNMALQVFADMVTRFLFRCEAKGIDSTKARQ